MDGIARVGCVVIALMAALTTTAFGQAGAGLVGAWRLLSYESRDSAGALQYPLGQGVVGQLMYDARGNMSAILMQPDRPAFAAHDLRRGTDAEVRAAFEGFIGYLGLI